LVLAIDAEQINGWRDDEGAEGYLALALACAAMPEHLRCALTPSPAPNIRSDLSNGRMNMKG
jgi:hypothetical protein